MAEKGFGVKEVNLIGASGTPTITSPNNLNLNANNVAISTNVSIGGTLSVTGNVSVGGTLTYEDVTNIDSIGIITARSVIQAGAGLTVVGVSTFNSDVHLGLHGAGNPKIHFDESGDLLWFKKASAGGSSSKLGLGNGTSYDHLQLQQTYTGGGQSEITAYNSNILISAVSAEKNITLQSTNDITLANGVYPFVKCEENSSTDQSVTLYHGQTGSTPYANPKLVTANTGVVITGICTATTFSGSGASLTTLNATQLTSGTIPDARFPSTLPAVSGANLTNIAAPVEAPVVNFTVTANGSSAYRFSGGGVDSSADDPDLYLIRGQKYRFNNTTGSAHPFQFRLTTGGSAYTDGITGDQNGVQFFTPALDAPSKLYYICTLHSGMVGTIYLRGAGGNNENVGVTTITGANGNLLNVNHTGGSGAQGVIRTKASQANSSSFIRAEDSGGTYIGLLKYGTGHSAYGALGAGDGAIYANSGGGNDTNITIMADSATGYINFATGGNTERLRIESTGNLLLQPANPGSSSFYPYMNVLNGQIKKYMQVKILNSGQGTKFTFTGTDRTAALITIKVAHSWTASNTGNRHGSAIFAAKFFNTSTGGTGWGGITLIQTDGYSTGNFILSNESGFDYSIKVNNPLSDSGISFCYDIEVMSASNTSKHSLTSVTVV